MCYVHCILNSIANYFTLLAWDFLRPDTFCWLVYVCILMYILPRYYLNLSMLLKGIYGQVAYTFGAFIINESNTHSHTHVRLAELNSM